MNRILLVDDYMHALIVLACTLYYYNTTQKSKEVRPWEAGGTFFFCVIFSPRMLWIMVAQPLQYGVKPARK